MTPHREGQSGASLHQTNHSLIVQTLQTLQTLSVGIGTWTMYGLVAGFHRAVSLHRSG